MRQFGPGCNLSQKCRIMTKKHIMKARGTKNEQKRTNWHI